MRNPSSRENVKHPCQEGTGIPSDISRTDATLQDLGKTSKETSAANSLGKYITPEIWFQDGKGAIFPCGKDGVSAEDCQRMESMPDRLLPLTSSSRLLCPGQICFTQDTITLTRTQSLGIREKNSRPGDDEAMMGTNNTFGKGATK